MTGHHPEQDGLQYTPEQIEEIEVRKLEARAAKEEELKKGNQCGTKNYGRVVRTGNRVNGVPTL